METDENENSSKAEKTEEVVNNDQEPQQTDQLTKLDASQTDISSDDKEEKVDQVKTESSSPKPLVLPTKLFDNVRYHILNTKNSEIERLLDENGAYKEPYLGSLITHVICDDPADNSDYSEAKEVFDLTIIKSEWVVKCIETNSLLPTEPFAHEHSSHILSKCTFLNVNVPSEIALKLGALISFYGGKMRNVDRVGEVSHAFSCLYDESTKRFGSVHASVKLITPAWLVDSLLAGKLLDEAAYSPKYLRNNPDLASVIESIEDDSRKVKDEEVTGVASEPQPTTTTAAVETKTQHKISLFVTPHSNQPVHQQTAPTTMKLPDQITPATNNLSTVAANQMASPSGGTHQSAPGGLKTTPPHQQQPQRKRPRKQSNNNPASIDEDSSKAAAFTSDMNEIFQSVISASQSEEQAELAASKAASAPQYQPQPIVSSSSSSTHSLAANNIGMHHQPHLQQLQHQQQQQQQQQQRVVYNQQQPVAAQKTPLKNPLPVQFELTQKSKQGATSYFDAFYFTDSSSSSSNNNELSVQENAHLITFDCCLLGCVFYVKPNESHYTSECVQDWTQVIERFGGRCVPDYDAYAAQITHVICSDRFSDIYRKALGDKKRTCTIFWLEDVLQEQKMRQPWLAYHFPSPHDPNNGPLKNHIISTHGFTGKEKLILRTLICLMGGKYTNYLSNVNTYLICREQEKADSTKTNGSGVAASGASKVDKARKWGINVVNGVWLNELYLGNTYALTRTPIDERYRALDVHNHLYYDGLLVHEFMEQWKQLISLPLELIRQARMTASSPLKQANRARYTRLLSPSNSSCAFNTSARADSAKIPRIEGSNGTGYFDSNNISEGISWMKPQLNIPCVMFTGIDQTDVIQYQKDVISLGGVIAKQPSQATYLIVNKIERTAKLLKCISTCEYIVNIKWLLDSKMVGKFCDPNNYQVVDERFEKHYGCNLKESMARARERKFLLSGLSFYLSPSVRPSHQDLTEMIKSAGGNVLIDAQRVQHFQEPFNDLNKTGLTSKCVVIGSQKDISILKPFIDRKIPIYNEELILSGLLKQKLEANLYKFYTTQ